MTFANHATCCLLNGKEPAESRNFHGLPHRFRIDLGDRTVRSSAWVVNDDIGFPQLLIHLLKELCHGRRIRGLRRK